MLCHKTLSFQEWGWKGKGATYRNILAVNLFWKKKNMLLSSFFLHSHMFPISSLIGRIFLPKPLNWLSRKFTILKSRELKGTFQPVGMSKKSQISSLLPQFLFPFSTFEGIYIWLCISMGHIRGEMPITQMEKSLPPTPLPCLEDYHIWYKRLPYHHYPYIDTSQPRSKRDFPHEFFKKKQMTPFKNYINAISANFEFLFWIMEKRMTKNHRIINLEEVYIVQTVQSWLF